MRGVARAKSPKTVNLLVTTSICTAATRLYIKTPLDGTTVVSGDTAVYTAVCRLATTVYSTSAGCTIEYPTSSALRRDAGARLTRSVHDYLTAISSD